MAAAVVALAIVGVVVSVVAWLSPVELVGGHASRSIDIFGLAQAGSGGGSGGGYDDYYNGGGRGWGRWWRSVDLIHSITRIIGLID